jgi:uncharacterized protein (DUF433 family)
VNDSTIVEVDRNPRIAGTRISVYLIFEFVQAGWRPSDIAFWLSIRKDEVEAAIRYIEEHKDEVTAEYAKIMERINRGNPPELQAKLDAAHDRLQGILRERRRSKGLEVHDEGHSSGQ